ncbi:V-type ATP synthase subunit F [Imhoffiella purpurea]|uniref:V-type ATP synthase subunit F n=1 Tax=Imhoffiella purpurea TaxID=1249627 RepID=W9VB15_9GAMM|nr:V-type ATP synthase subunit F [Imhoffiella purpurea]EXJ14131.1 hypothetical protein D779_2945 [Imhoffiella purpurea]
MAFCAFIGDAVTAAGFRLAGVAVHHPCPGEATDLFERLCLDSRLILITTEMAEALPPDRLRQVQRAGRPLVLVVSDARGLHPAPDLAGRMRHQLGLGE